MDTSEDAALEALWHQVLERWDQEEVHGAFLEAAVLVRRLPFAATRYRTERVHPEHAERAEQQLARITVQALSLLEGTRSPPPDHKKTIQRVALAVSAALIAGSIFAMTR